MQDLSLFAIEQELKELFETIGQDGIETEENKSVTISKLNEALSIKTDNVAEFRKSLEMFIEYIDEKISELKTRKEFYERKIDKFDEYVSNCLSIQDKKEINGSLYKIMKRKPAQVVQIYDETKIPLEFIHVPEPKPTIMKSEIAKALKSGEVVDGAKLVDGNISIQYRVK